MYISTNRSGWASRKISAKVELETSPSSDDDPPVLGAERRERLAVRLAGRDGATDLVRRPRRGRRLEAVCAPGLRLRDVDLEVAEAAELLDRLLGDRLAVPAVLVLHLRVALPLHRSRDDRGRPSRRRLGLAVGGVDRLDVVAVDLDRMPAERLEPARVRGEVPAVHRLATLAEPVDVDDRGEVVELVEGRVLRRLPHRPLGHLAVAADHPDAEREAVELLPGDRHPDADRQSLPERSRRDVDPGEDGHRMPLEPGAELPVGPELLLGERARGAEEAVHEWRGVALGEDEPVVPGVVRRVEVVAQMPCEEDRREVGRRHRGRRVPGAGLRARPNRVDPQLLSQLPPKLALVHEGSLVGVSRTPDCVT